MDLHLRILLPLALINSLRVCVALFAGISTILVACANAAAGSAADLIREAGNAHDERDRRAALAQLALLPGISPDLKKEAEAMAELSRKWRDSSLKFYTAALRSQGKRGIPAEYPFGVAGDSPLKPLTDLYRGRMLAWMLIENSTIRTDPVQSRWFRDESQACFRRMGEAFPQNEVARMYLGERLPWGELLPPVAGAPDWATLQREQLERLTAIIHWWIDHRQRPNGEFGGGWGDDCEMWRWWSAVLLGFEDPKIVAAQLKFSKAAVERPHLEGGFQTAVMDVEHAAEDTTDNLVPLLVLEPDNEKWLSWGRKLGNFMKEVWTGRNERGQLQFKSFYFSATEAAPQEQRAFDVIANVGALHPALLAWQRTGDEALGSLICDWLGTWVDATAREENGKPAGVLPAAIRWPDGAVAGAEGRWWEPVKPGGYMHSYYVWPSVITELTDALVLAHAMTGRERFLDPLRSLAAIRLEYLTNPPAGRVEPGTRAWCGAELAPRPNANSNTGGLVKSLARLKALTGTAEFDALLAREGAEFVFRDTPGGRRELEAALHESLGALRVNFPGFTSEVRSTDRVMRFIQFLAEDYEFDAYKGVTQPKHELLYRMVTGDTNAPRFPQPALRLRTPPKDIAVLVTQAGRSTLRAELFHFGPEPREVVAECGQLRPGEEYEAHGQADGTRTPLIIQPASASPASSRLTIPLTLPPRKLCVLEVRRRE